MADEGNHMHVKRRGVFNIAVSRFSHRTDSPPLHSGEASSFLSPPTPSWRFAGEPNTRGGESPFSGSATPFSGSSSFVREPNTSLSYSFTAPAAAVHRTRVPAAPTQAAAPAARSSGGESTSGISGVASGNFYGHSLRRLRTTWRRRCFYRRRGVFALLMFFFVLYCVRWSGDAGVPSTSVPTAASESTEDPNGALGGVLEDTLLDISAMGPQEELSGDLSSWSVLVQHNDAMTRLPLTAAQRTCLADITSAGCGLTHMHVGRPSLPSWTLAAEQEACLDCVVRRPYTAAVAGAALAPRHAVLTTTSSPAGRVGPMLFAMSSATNDVAVREELPKWSWMRHVYPSLSERLGEKSTSPAAEAGAAVRRPYLAVMGVPSTDQPARVALRVAQRATWMTYEEVARTENNFQGALLPLYLFAAVEPSMETTTTEELVPAAAAAAAAAAALNDDGMLDDGDATEATDAPTATTTTARPTLPPPRPGARLCGHTDSLLPTVRDFQQASDVLAGGAAGGFMQRRVVLRADHDTMELSQSPCRGVSETYVSAADVAELPLSQIARHVGLNVTPAFVSAAEFVCCASAGLWQEALTHRNVVWIDMMTDRKPTTNKKLGDTKKWGLPVEVGMSQKLILWLLYAHNSFTDVPYIIKGDDDMYLKVPQFMNDMRLLRRGPRNGRPTPPHAKDDATSTTGAVALSEDTAAVSTTGCLYWGSTRRMGGVFFNAGMLFVLQRRLVGVVLEKPENATDTDLLELAAMHYSRSRLSLYKRTQFDKEDVLMGYTLNARRAHAEAVCPHNRVLYARESLKRFHDMRRGRVNPVTWATVVAHRCRPADEYFLHYFFAQELRFSLADVAPGESREEVAREAAAAWVAETQRTLPAGVTDWRSLPDVRWNHNVSAGPEYWMAPKDRVPVYNVSYHWWKDDKAGVRAGYKTVA